MLSAIVCLAVWCVVLASFLTYMRTPGPNPGIAPPKRKPPKPGELDYTLELMAEHFVADEDFAVEDFERAVEVVIRRRWGMPLTGDLLAFLDHRRPAGLPPKPNPSIDWTEPLGGQGAYRPIHVIGRAEPVGYVDEGGAVHDAVYEGMGLDTEWR